jgi:DNA-directed RNA polymerase subunit H (RpoH/RPB5)
MTGEYKDAVVYLQLEGTKSTRRKKSAAVPEALHHDHPMHRIPDRIILIFTKLYKGHQVDNRIELVDAWRMMTNPTLHQWVPKHDKVSFEDLPIHVRDTVTIASLPVISTKDPISIWYGFKSGDIIRITRVSYESNNVMYRQVK